MSPRVIRVPAPSATLDVVAGSAEDHEFAWSNTTTHEFTHTFTSTTQDGTVYVIIGFAIDGLTSGVTPDAAVTQVLTAGIEWQGGHGIYHYKPSQADLDAGSITFTFTTVDSELAYVKTIEITGANSTNPVGATNSVTSENNNVTSQGPVSVTTGQADALLISFGSRDEADGGDLTMSNANSFTEFGATNPTVNAGFPDLLGAYRVVSSSAAYDSPTFAGSVAEEMHASIAEFIP